MSVPASIFSSFHSKRYTLLESCGQGGSSAVFKARDNQTNQTVAIKVFVDSSADNALLNRETQFSSLLQHPHVIRLLDKGLAQSFHYAVFEYIQGKTLKQVLFEAEYLSPKQVSELMKQVLSALCHCHQLGVIHRDVKPSNIMVTDYCGELHATLIDFGSATFDQNRRNQDVVDFSATQSIPLSPAYCAPSLLTGGQANQHSDLYSWGLILLECLSGKQRSSGPADIALAINELLPANSQISDNLTCHPIQWLLQRVFSIDMPEGALNTSDLYNLFVQLDFSSINQTARLTESQASNVKQQILDNTQSIQPASYAQPTTEQKQITALCLNLAVKKSLDVGSQVSSYEESEFLSALHKNLQSQCIDIAQRHGAKHVSTLGDTMLFYFGYPIVTASDCYLSAKTAKQIIDFLIQQNNQLSQEQQIVCSSSVGIHSGLVTIKNDTIPEGETPNIAISVARLANNNQVLCTRAVREMLSSDFDFKVYEVVNLGHKQRPQSLHTMLGNRQQANQPARNVRLFVGRKKELAQLSSFFNGITPKATAQHHIHILGEAGIGKSRLIFEYRQQSKVKTQVITHCVPEHKTQTLQPIFALLKSKYCLNSCCEGSALTLLHQEIASHSGLNHDTAMYLMCSYLGYALPNQYACSLMSSRETQNILFECLGYLLCKKPNTKSSGDMLIILEDIDSIDVTSIEFLQHLKSSGHFINSNSCLITSSSKNITGFVNDNGVSHIQLETFSQEESTTFVSQLFNGLYVTDVFANLIYERTEGNPLFIIKFMNMLKDKGDISILNNKLYLRSTKDIFALPDCLRDTLQDKLDHLQSAKKITQLASIIGLEFDLELLAASYAGDTKQLQMMLDELLNENLIESRPSENGHTFAFKHPFLCETAYTSIPENQRRAIHSRVASVLETKQRTSKKEELSLALQWLKAGQPEKSNRPASK